MWTRVMGGTRDDNSTCGHGYPQVSYPMGWGMGMKFCPRARTRGWNPAADIAHTRKYTRAHQNITYSSSNAGIGLAQNLFHTIAHTDTPHGRPLAYPFIPLTSFLHFPLDSSSGVIGH